MVKNRAPHGRKPFSPYGEPEFAVICKECVLLLMKQYYTITPCPDKGREGFVFKNN